ncbi:MAG: glyoxalase [Bdellovibrionales bacterium RIFCSPHIGHO2_01_FULL_40_29]|nr:MAG: glyoxalase [Bdellovibrionales bacterium RIFCSPHIGHO2_01_FULL_40_29]OFZ34867.1 MAG: glyoxalase [Bdellovibrionales bacterium RIFCSPHIGHO2_02_FULL_40_15]
MIQIQQIHHVAYRCRDAKETAEWYKKNLNMDLLVCIAEDRVPSTKEPDPYMHIFLDAGCGNILAFFEITGSPPMDRDQNTPKWVQHIAFQVSNTESLVAAKAELEAKGLEVIGITEHGIIRSIYFFDPNGHRVELTCVIGSAEQMKHLKEIAPTMLNEWSRTKQPPRQAAWLHKQEFEK